MASLAEWFTGQMPPELSKESSRILDVVILPDRVNSLTHYLAPDALSMGVSIQRAYLDVGFTHWSRRWEYPWIVHHGDFQSHHKVLDAGGCSSILPYRLAQLSNEVCICDMDHPAWSRYQQSETHALWGKNITFVPGDIHKLPFADGCFDRVTCVSVLEHCKDPQTIVSELYRVTALGGRLLVTMDVANYWRENHAVDAETAACILSNFGLPYPQPPQNRRIAILDEHPDRDPREPDHVALTVLACYVDKEYETQTS